MVATCGAVRGSGEVGGHSGSRLVWGFVAGSLVLHVHHREHDFARGGGGPHPRRRALVRVVPAVRRACLVHQPDRIRPQARRQGREARVAERRVGLVPAVRFADRHSLVDSPVAQRRAGGFEDGTVYAVRRAVGLREGFCIRAFAFSGKPARELLHLRGSGPCTCRFSGRGWASAPGRCTPALHNNTSRCSPARRRGSWRPRARAETCSCCPTSRPEGATVSAWRW